MNGEFDHDPVFGALQCDEDRRSFEAAMEIPPGHKVTVTIDWMGVAPDEALEKARELYAIVVQREPEYRQGVASALLKLYNEDWQEGEAMDEAGFMRRISLSSINIAPVEFGNAGCVSLDYSDGDLFAGHWIEVFLDAELRFVGAQLAG